MVQTFWSECLDDDVPSSGRPFSGRRDDPIVDLGRFKGLPAHQKVLTMLLLSGFAQGATQICLRSRAPVAYTRDVRVYFRLDCDGDEAPAPPEFISEQIVSTTHFMGEIAREFPPLPMEVAPLVLDEIRRLAGLDAWHSRILRRVPHIRGKGAFRIRAEEHEREVFVLIVRSWRETLHVLTIGWHHRNPPASP
jgi:hypothetical protein